MTEAQAWEQLYGRRSPDVRVLRREPGELGDESPGRADVDARGYVARSEQPPASEAHAA